MCDWVDVDVCGFGCGLSVFDCVWYVVRDVKVRFALSSSDGGVVGERLFSDVVYGCVFCVVMMYVLGVVDCWMCVNVMVCVLFMIGVWASLSVLAFGVVDASSLRWWNLIVVMMCLVFIGVLLVCVFGVNYVVCVVVFGVLFVVMMCLGAIYSFAGAVAFAVVESFAFVDLGWWFVVYFVFIGVVFIVCVGKVCEWVKLNCVFEFVDVVCVFLSVFLLF